MPIRLSDSLLRRLYSVLLCLFLPVIFCYLFWRGIRTREYWQRWRERFAFYRQVPRRADVWLHAVSVGEVNAAAPVVNALRAQRPDLRWVITTITPTGSARVRALWGTEVDHVYLPYDLRGCVRRFLGAYRPQLALILETELWPNLLFACRDKQIPVYVLNARLSERSLRSYRLMAPLIRRSLRTVSRVAAQSEEDAARFVRLGAAPEQVSALGNLKFEIQTPPREAILGAFRQHIVASRPVWIAASTHEGEEAHVLAIHAQLRQWYPDLLLLWAPRHPERFAKVEYLARDEGWRVATRSVQQWPSAETEVFVLDTLGELMGFFACADVAFVGGSLQPVGGHNLLEPAAMGTAVVTGPHLHNFAEISKRMREAGALQVGRDASAVMSEIERLLGDTVQREQMVQAGLRLVANGRGAVDRVLELIRGHLPPAVSQK